VSALAPIISLLVAATTAAAPPVKFMGLESEATTVAFVCDGSRWTRKKIDDLGEQLLLTVDAMSPEQSFAVIFFADDKAFGPDDGRAMPATPANKQKLRNWLDGVELGRDSTPVPGLVKAFEARPDMIVFISSGEFDDYDGVAARVTQLNAGKSVRVHAIGFFETKDRDDSRSFARFTKALAEDNGGESRAVYADELRRKD
jgi:hypothetical protein